MIGIPQLIRIPKLTLAVAALLATAGALALAQPQTAAAESATAASVVELPLGSKGKGLRPKGTRQRALKPARLKKGGVLKLPVSDIVISSATRASIILRGGLKITRGKRQVKLQGLMIKVSGRNIQIEGRVGKRRVKVFSGRARQPLVNAQAHTVSAVGVAYKAKFSGGKLVRRALKLKKSPRGKLGKGTIFASVKLPAGQTADGQLQDLAGPRLARPATAVNVTSSSLKWWIRDSWIRYLPFNLPQDGATGDAPTQDHVCKDNWSPVSDVYAYNLPFSEGWWDAASGTGAFYYNGAVRWFFPQNGIDLIASSAEIEINGASSRAIFRFDDITDKTARRGAFVSLNIAEPLNAQPLAPGSPPSRLKATIFPDPATSPFGNFVTQYESVPGWGCFDLAFTL